MRMLLLGLVMVAAGVQATALAAPPGPLRVVETVEINAPPAKVWATIREFDGLNKWHPGFSSAELVSGRNGQVGAVRKLTIKDGPSFTERLLKFDDHGHSYHYQIIESPLPIDRYTSSIMVRPVQGGMSRVVWIGHFRRKNPADNPPEAESDAGVTKLIQGVYRAGLDNLKKMLE
jgi:hypothetical protein